MLDLIEEDTRMDVTFEDSNELEFGIAPKIYEDFDIMAYDT